jgi:hypothetical protein
MNEADERAVQQRFSAMPHIELIRIANLPLNFGYPWWLQLWPTAHCWPPPALLLLWDMRASGPLGRCSCWAFFFSGQARHL